MPTEPTGSPSPDSLGADTASRAVPPEPKASKTALDIHPLADRPAPKRIQTVMLATGFALAVGALLAWLEPPQYRCVATFHVSGVTGSVRFSQYRMQLSDFVRSEFERTDPRDSTLQPWSLESPNGTILRLGVIVAEPSTGLDDLRRLAGRFCEHMDAQAQGARQRQSEAEKGLAQYGDALRTRWTEARSSADRTDAVVPAVNPDTTRLGEIDRWDSFQADLAEIRGQLGLAETLVTRLETGPSPTHAVVSRSDREEALKADDALEQDLRELRVNLTELKLHLLNVWQQSSGPLEPLELAVDDLIAIVSPQRLPEVEASTSALLAPVRTAAQAYRTALASFSQTWHREFTLLRRIEPDPHNAQIVDQFQTVRRSLRDFLFDGSKRMTALRASVRAVSEDPTGSARLHVFHANLTRAFQTAQTAHHRFEFAAGALETPENFRLDAALLGARGLRRRTRDRIQSIDTKLQAKAIERSRELRLIELQQARMAVRQRRAAYDQSVDRMLELQTQLNRKADETVAYLKATQAAGIASARAQVLHDELGVIDTRLQDLATERQREADASDVTLVSCEVQDRPANSAQRLRVGGLGGALAFLAVLLTQWWVMRQS